MRYIYLIILPLILLGACKQASDLSAVSLLIYSPVSDSLHTSETMIRFWWEPDKNAEQYSFATASPNFDSPVTTFDTLTDAFLLDIDMAEGIYHWRVRAENEETNSEYQTGILILDHTPPTLTLITPEDLTAFGPSDDITLNWESEDSPIDNFKRGVTDSVFVSYLDGMTWTPSASFSRESGARSVSLPSGLDLGEYRWEVISFDAVLNRQSSEVRYFTIQ